MAEGDGIETIKFPESPHLPEALLKQGVPMPSWQWAMWTAAGLCPRAIVAEMPWKDFIKKPQARCCRL